MIFASFEFLFLFLPLFFAVYFLTPARLRNWPILLLSWAFYAWWRVDFLALLAGVTLFTFLVARAMDARGPQSVVGKRLLLLGLVGNLGVLAWFKYANFGVDTLNALRAGWGLAPLGWQAILLPIGLSFYVLQSVSYLVDLSVATSRSAAASSTTPPTRRSSASSSPARSSVTPRSSRSLNPAPIAWRSSASAPAASCWASPPRSWSPTR